MVKSLIKSQGILYLSFCGNPAGPSHIRTLFHQLVTDPPMQNQARLIEYSKFDKRIKGKS